MDPFHVARLAGDALDLCRRRVQQARHGPRPQGRPALQRPPDPAHRSRPAHRQAGCSTAEAVRERCLRQRSRQPGDLPAHDRGLSRTRSRTRPGTDGPTDRVAQPGRTRRAGRGHHAGQDPDQAGPDVLAYFDRPGTSNGPTEAINGRLEHLRGSALGFRNLTNYIARSLLEAGGFRPQLHPGL